MRDEIPFVGFPNMRMKKRKSETILTRVPKEFIRSVDMKTIVDGFSSRQDCLRELSKEIRPGIKDLKNKGLLRDIDDEFEN